MMDPDLEDEYHWKVQSHRDGQCCPFCIVKKGPLSKKGFQMHLRKCQLAMAAAAKFRRPQDREVPLVAGPKATVTTNSKGTGRDHAGRSTRNKRKRKGVLEGAEDETVWSVGWQPPDNPDSDEDSLREGVGHEVGKDLQEGFHLEEILLEEAEFANLSRGDTCPYRSQRDEEEADESVAGESNVPVLNGQSLDPLLNGQSPYRAPPRESNLWHGHALSEHTRKTELAHDREGGGQRHWERLGTVVESVAQQKILTVCPTMGKLMLSMLRLTLFCDDSSQQSRCFQDGYNALLKKEIADNGLDPMTMPSRRTVVRWAYQQFGTRLTKAQAVVVRRTTHANPYDHQNPRQGLETRDRDLLHVLKFDVLNGCRSLVRNRNLWGDMNNVVANREDPFLPYEKVGEGLDEALDGTWWPCMLLELQRRGIFDPHREFIFPVVIYMDKTGTTGNQRYPLEPLVFTFLNIRRALRNLPDFWMMAGYLPDLDGKSSAEKQQHRQRNRGASSETYHRALSVILQVFKELETTGFSDWVRMGNRLKMMRLRFYIAYVIGDGKSADMLANRIGAHKNAKRISRACDCTQKECASVVRKCNYLHMGTFQKHFKRLEVSPQTIMEEIKRARAEQVTTCAQLTKLFLADRRKVRKAMISHGIQPSINAFVLNNISFGYDKHGIFGALPTDLMHAFQSGVLPYLLRIALDMLSPTEKAALDELVDRILYRQRSSCKKDYPRYCFANGFSSLTQLTSDEWVGTLFTLLLVLRTEEGNELFTGECKFSNDDYPLPPTFEELDKRGDVDSINTCAALMEEAAKNRLGVEPESEDHDPPDIVNEDTGEIDNPEDLGEEDDPMEAEEEDTHDQHCSIHDFITLLEALLCFHGWYKFGVFQESDLERYQASISKMIAMLQFYVPREKGNGWNLQKLHDILHLPFFMGRYGHPGNFDAEVGESGLRTWAKWAAGTAAKRGNKNSFVAQCASRMDERLTLEIARRELSAERNAVPKLDNSGRRIPPPGTRGGNPSLGGSRFSVSREPGNAIWLSGRSKARVGMTHVHPLIESSLRSLKCTNPRNLDEASCPPKVTEGDAHWEVHTECTMAHPRAGNRFTMRCHPDYHSEGSWHDWVEVKYTASSFRGDPQHSGRFLHKHSVPAKVLAFLRHPESEEIHALIHPCKWKERSDMDTVLTEVWCQEFKWRGQDATPVVEVVSVKSIMGLCLVIEEVPGLKESVSRGDEGFSEEFDVALLVRDRKSWGDHFT